MKRKIFRWVKIGLLLYAVAGIALYFSQDAILFHPAPVPRTAVYDLGGQPFKEVNLPYDKETNLNIIQFTPRESAKDTAGDSAMDTPRDSAKGVVLYFHGNKSNSSRYAAYAKEFTAHGYEVWMLDYPGFGKSTGAFTEKKIYDDALLLYKLARSRWKPSQIILYGKSLGTGIAAQLADVRDCRRLILETPYYSLESVAAHYLPFYPWGRLLHYHFNTYTHLPAVTAPVTIFEGTADWLVPYNNAARLKPLLKPNDEFVTIEGGGHNDLHQFPLFREKLDSVLER
jgi:uncharacterized protein